MPTPPTPVGVVSLCGCGRGRKDGCEVILWIMPVEDSLL